jgi:hypothetical protein
MNATPVVRPQRVARWLDQVAGFGAPPSLELDALVARASQVSGCAPPEEGRYLEPLRVVLDAAQGANLNALGRRMLPTALVMRLQNHFAIEAWLAQHPEILDRPVAPPVVIASLPRTGTTALHRLLSVHPSFRALCTRRSVHVGDGPAAADAVGGSPPAAHG